MKRAETVAQRIERENREQENAAAEAIARERAILERARQVAAARRERRARVEQIRAEIAAELEEIRIDPAASNRRNLRDWWGGPEHEAIRAEYARLRHDPPTVTARRLAALRAATTQTAATTAGSRTA